MQLLVPFLLLLAVVCADFEKKKPKTTTSSTSTTLATSHPFVAAIVPSEVTSAATLDVSVNTKTTFSLSTKMKTKKHKHKTTEISTSTKSELTIETAKITSLVSSTNTKISPAKTTEIATLTKSKLKTETTKVPELVTSTKSSAAKTTATVLPSIATLSHDSADGRPSSNCTHATRFQIVKLSTLDVFQRYLYLSTRGVGPNSLSGTFDLDFADGSRVRVVCDSTNQHPIRSKDYRPAYCDNSRYKIRFDGATLRMEEEHRTDCNLTSTQRRGTYSEVIVRPKKCDSVFSGLASICSWGLYGEPGTFPNFKSQSL